MQKEKTLLEQIRDTKNTLLKLEDKKDSIASRLYTKHPLKVGDRIKYLNYIPFKKYEFLLAIVVELNVLTYDGRRTKIEFLDKECKESGVYNYICESLYEFERI